MYITVIVTVSGALLIGRLSGINVRKVDLYPGIIAQQRPPN